MDLQVIDMIAPGTPVSVGSGDDKIPGVVLSAMIEGESSISYRVAWWEGRQRKSEWLMDCEVHVVHSPQGPLKARMGFSL